jgi:hypothetical protein
VGENEKLSLFPEFQKPLHPRRERPLSGSRGRDACEHRHDADGALLLETRRGLHRLGHGQGPIQGLLVCDEHADDGIGEDRGREPPKLRHPGTHVNEEVVWLELLLDAGVQVEQGHQPLSARIVEADLVAELLECRPIGPVRSRSRGHQPQPAA